MFEFLKQDVHEFIVEEKDVTIVLGVINSHRRGSEFSVGNCGWNEAPTKWFINFDSTDEQYGHIVDELNKLGAFELNVSPDFTRVDLYYKRGGAH